MDKQIQCHNTLKNWKKSREREIPEEDEKVFLGLWRNWSEAGQTFSLRDTDTDTVAEAKQSLKAKPKPQRIYVTDSIFFFLLDFCFTDIVNYCKVTFGAWQRGNRVGIKYYLNFHILGILEYLLF